MPHLSNGTLRRFVDEPFVISTRQRGHLGGCPRCQSRFATIKDNIRAVAHLLAASDGSPDTMAALKRQRAAFAGVVATAPSLAERIALRRRSGTVPARRRARLWSAIAIVAAVVGGSVVLPAGTWAHDFLSVFEPDAFATVPVTTKDLRTLPDLTQYGVMRAPANPTSRPAANLEAARSMAGFMPKSPATIPATVSGKPSYAVFAPVSASFTFSAARVRQAAAKAGDRVPLMPAWLDGSVLRMSVGPVVVTTYGQRGASELSVPDLVIVQARIPVVTATGASVQQIEQYLLAQPGVSDQLRSEIRAIGDPAATLPIPVPIDLVHADIVSVQGQRALAMGDSTNLGSGVLWRKDGMVYAVAGSHSEQSVIAFANSLR